MPGQMSGKVTFRNATHGVRAEVLRRPVDLSVEARHSGPHDDDDERDVEDDVRDEDREQAAGKVQGQEEAEQRRAEHDRGRGDVREHHHLGGRLPVEPVADQRQRDQRAEIVATIVLLRTAISSECSSADVSSRIASTFVHQVLVAPNQLNASLRLGACVEAEQDHHDDRDQRPDDHGREEGRQDVALPRSRFGVAAPDVDSRLDRDGARSHVLLDLSGRTPRVDQDADHQPDHQDERQRRRQRVVLVVQELSWTMLPIMSCSCRPGCLFT